MADAEEPDEVIARKADKAIELVETVLEAGAGQADEAVDLVIEAILVADAEELDEAILEACADQADEAVDLAIEAILVAGGEEANEVILVAVFRPREFFESRPQQTLEGV